MPGNSMLDGEALRREGYAVVRSAIDPNRCAALGQAIVAEFERLERSGKGFGGPGRLAGNLNLAPGAAGAFLLPALEGLRQAAGEALGADLVPVQLGGNFNLPGSVFQDFHRDATDAVVRVVANIGLIEGTDANGPIELVPGSAGVEGYRRFFRDGWPARAVRMPLAPGDVLFRRLQLWHRGTANRSGAARPMAAVVWVERSVAADVPAADGPIGFAGNRFYGRFPRLEERLAVHVPALAHLLRYARSAMPRD